MEIHLKWNRSNLWKAARKIESWARFNFYVYTWPSMHCLFFIYAPTRNIKVTRQSKYILTRWDWTELLNKMPGLSKNIKCLLNAGPLEKRDPDCQKQRTRVLWPSWPGWVNQSVYMEKNGPARRVTCHRKNWPGLLAEPKFYFSCKRFATFCKEIYEQLTSPGWLE